MGIPDVDLDVANRDNVVHLIEPKIIASQFTPSEDQLVPHNTGLYCQKIPNDPISGLATFPYKVAEDFGYYKVDIINNKVYEPIGNEEHLDALIAHAESDEFDWTEFLDGKYYTNKDTDLRLTQLAKHMDLVEQYPPRSIDDLAVLIALIRPQKKHLIGESWNDIVDSIWKKDDDQSYSFKKSHAIAYALLVAVHIQLLDAQIG